MHGNILNLFARWADPVFHLLQASDHDNLLDI